MSGAFGVDDLSFAVCCIRSFRFRLVLREAQLFVFLRVAV
jgi:hypothetical protein